MLSKEQKDEECDATGDAICTEAGKKIIAFKLTDVPCLYWSLFFH